jgi:hypothetical protein
MVDEKSKSSTAGEQQKPKYQGRRFQSRRQEGEKKEYIPILKYGKGNNYYQFQQALYKKVIDYGDLAKLIILNKYYVPEFTQPDYTSMGLDVSKVAMLRTELMKDFAIQVGRMKQDRPKLYGLILEHLSVESRDEVAQDADYEIWHNATDPEKLWQAITKTHKVDCVSNVSQVKELTARKAYQTIKQGPFESLAQYSERFWETY